MGSNSLDFLKALTVVVADTGDFESMKKFKPQDATTNPSLILSAAQMDQYKAIVDKAVAAGKALPQEVPMDERVELTVDRMFVLFGCEILKIVPGRVSTEVDARLSFDKEGQVNCKNKNTFESFKHNILYALSLILHILHKLHISHIMHICGIYHIYRINRIYGIYRIYCRYCI